MTTTDITTTNGSFEFTLDGTTMTVLNNDTGENIYNGEVDMNIFDEDIEHAAQAANGFINGFYTD